MNKTSDPVCYSNLLDSSGKTEKKGKKRSECAEVITSDGYKNQFVDFKISELAELVINVILSCYRHKISLEAIYNNGAEYKMYRETHYLDGAITIPKRAAITYERFE